MHPPPTPAETLGATAPSEATNGLATNKTVISLKIKFVYLPQENLQALRPAWPSPASGCGTLTTDQLDFVNQALRGTGNYFMSQCRIETFSGREAMMSLMPAATEDTNVSANAIFDVTPYASQESPSFRLDLLVRMSRTIQGSSQPDTQSIEKTNEAVLLPGQTEVLQKEIPEGFFPSTSSNESSKVLLVFVTPETGDAVQASQLHAAEVSVAANRNRLNSARQGALAVILFASDNQGQLPATLDQDRNYLKVGQDQSVETNFDLTYSGSISNIANPAQTILLRERQPQEMTGGWSKAYGFADGHAEIHKEPNGDFETFEKEHSVPSPDEQ